MGASVVAGWKAAPVLEAPEHAFAAVALSVERGIVGDGRFSVGAPGDAERDAEAVRGRAAGEQPTSTP